MTSLLGRRLATLPKRIINLQATNKLNQAKTHTNNNDLTRLVAIRWHGGPKISADAETISIIFQNPHPSSSSDGQSKTLQVEGRIGETLLQVAQRNGIDLEGACEGVCACSTCHLIFTDETIFDSLEEASEDEEDMLDMAFGLTPTSRLGCQITVTKDMDGMTVRLPNATRNFYVDGHVPQPH